MSGLYRLKDRLDTVLWTFYYHAQVRRGVHLTDLDEEQIIARLPESAFSIGSEPTGRPLPAAFREFVRSYSPRPRVLARFEDATLAGDRGLVFTKEGRPVVQITEPDAVLRRKLSQMHASRLSALQSLTLNPPRTTWTLEEPHLSMIHLWSDNYYHWTVEFLPQLRSLRQYEAKTGVRPDILVQHDPPEWIPESIRLTGISDGRIREWNGQPTRITELLVSDHRITTGGQHGSYDFSLDDHRWVREAVLSNLTNRHEERDERIYVSRQQSIRRVENFETIRRLLEKYGFEVYTLENMPVEDQARLFDAADHIVAPHGAGLTNILYAPSSASVLELLPGPQYNSNFFRIASMLGQRYSYIDCGTSYDPETFTVDTDQLATYLADL